MIYYQHKETKTRISLEDVLLAKRNNSDTTIHIFKNNIYSNTPQYITYKVNDVPFSKDFYIVNTDIKFNKQELRHIYNALSEYDRNGLLTELLNKTYDMLTQAEMSN